MAEQKTKALVLFSGGLDSRLVVKLLQEQGIDAECLYFKLPSGCGCSAKENEEFAEQNKLKLTIVDCTKGKLFKEYLNVIKKPKFSRGTGMNPCIDCKIFMFKKAKEYADMVNSDGDTDSFQNCPDREFYKAKSKNKRILYKQKPKIEIIATGEVLGERPLSQTSKALAIIDKEIGFELLRPLSAKLLAETKAEKLGLINREALLDIQGRQRKTQLELAKKFNIKYPQPAGGCLLCEKAYSAKLKDLFKNKEDISEAELETLRAFRHFRSADTHKKIILGKDYQENALLGELNKKLKWNILIPEENPGPTALFEDKSDKNLVLQLIEAYSSKNLEERKKFLHLLISF
jgi:hypothetical protein